MRPQQDAKEVKTSSLPIAASYLRTNRNVNGVVETEAMSSMNTNRLNAARKEHYARVR